VERAGGEAEGGLETAPMSLTAPSATGAVDPGPSLMMATGLEVHVPEEVALTATAEASGMMTEIEEGSAVGMGVREWVSETEEASETTGDQVVEEEVSETEETAMMIGGEALMIGTGGILVGTETGGTLVVTGVAVPGARGAATLNLKGGNENLKGRNENLKELVVVEVSPRLVQG